MIKTIFDFYYHALKNDPRPDAFTQKMNGRWVSLSSAEIVEKSKRFSTGLLQLGLQKGDRIAVISNNRTEWHLTDLAVQQIGVINVPIYTNITEADYQYILNDCGAKFAFVSDGTIAGKIKNIQSGVVSLNGIYTFDEVAGFQHYSDLLQPEIDEEAIQAAQAQVHEDDVATFIYTSGTTGNPKGVMLTHRNLVSNVV
ncbi:MAG: AMP-binding protein, partial [Flavobacteriales bacterium]|nr:AMP-binding protein [Flavobacteriales bacterium]